MGVSRNDSPADGRLREAYGQEMEGRRGEPREACPDPEVILQLAEGRGEERDRLKTLDHVMGCPECHHDFQRLRAIAEGRPREPRRMQPWLAAAASAVLLFGAGYALWGPAPWNRPAVMRGEDRVVTLLTPEPGASISEVPLFAWHSHPDAYEYTFEVLGEDERQILVRSTPDTVIRMETLSLEAGDPSRWWVRARLRDGTIIVSEPRTLGRAPD